MISDRKLRRMVNDFLVSPSGKKFLKENGVSYSPYSEKEAKAAAQDLKSRISMAFIAQQKTENNPHFDDKKVRIRTVVNKDGSVKVTITYPKDTLARSSLSALTTKHAKSGYNRNSITGKRFTGEGIYDIFALFTNGYKLKGGSPMGYWWDNDEGGERVSSRPLKNGRDPDIVTVPKSKKGSKFITMTIEGFKRDYPGIDVEYPKEWM